MSEMFRLLRFVLLICPASQLENCESSLLQFAPVNFTAYSDENWLSATLAAANDWQSPRLVGVIAQLHHVATDTVEFTIFSAVPVFGSDRSYIALLTERHNVTWCNTRGRLTECYLSKNDIYIRKPDVTWPQKLARGMSCSGPNRSHLIEAKFKGSVVICDWPHEEQDKKNFKVSLEDANGTILANIVASHDPTLLQQLAKVWFWF